MAEGSDVGNSGNYPTGRSPGKGAGFMDLEPEKWPNPAQSKMWWTVRSPIPRELFEFMLLYRHKAEMKDLQGNSITYFTPS
jgi:hypothetical protein